MFFFLAVEKNITVSVELVNKYSSDSVKPKTSENKFKKNCTILMKLYILVNKNDKMQKGEKKPLLSP